MKSTSNFRAQTKHDICILCTVSQMAKINGICQALCLLWRHGCCSHVHLFSQVSLLPNVVQQPGVVVQCTDILRIRFECQLQLLLHLGPRAATQQKELSQLSQQQNNIFIQNAPIIFFQIEQLTAVQRDTFASQLPLTCLHVSLQQHGKKLGMPCCDMSCIHPRTLAQAKRQ